MGALRRTRTERGGYFLQHTRAVLKNIVVPEPNNTPSISRQRLVPYVVIVITRVLSAVGFDDETGLYTGKIDYVGRDQMLPSETPAELLAAQPIPKEALRFCRIPPQTANAPNYGMSASHALHLLPARVEMLPHLFLRSKLAVPPP